MYMYMNIYIYICMYTCAWLLATFELSACTIWNEASLQLCAVGCVQFKPCSCQSSRGFHWPLKLGHLWSFALSCSLREGSIILCSREGCRQLDIDKYSACWNHSAPCPLNPPTALHLVLQGLGLQLWPPWVGRRHQSPGLSKGSSPTPTHSKMYQFSCVPRASATTKLNQHLPVTFTAR